MSAIHGLLRFDGAFASERDLTRQAKALRLRGPDGERQWRDGAVGLGHLAMHVIRGDDMAVQPIREGAVTLVADVRLDNRSEIAAALPIDPPSLNRLADSEILLKAYARWGEDCVDHLVGDFAFALWDGSRQTLLLARDHMGQRHLHYYAGKGFFAFASEVKGLAALPDVPSKLALSTLARQLAVDGTRRKGATILQGIFGLEGGTIMRVSASGEITTRQYWVPRADPKHLNRDEAYYIKTYREVLTEAVGCRVRRARRPPALLLGGGFDSGAIAGLSSTALVDGTKLVCVTSVGSDPAHGVRKWSGILASHMPHLTMRYVTRDGIDALTDIERNFLRDAEPYSPNRYASEALYAAAAATGARVIMDGHGGDYTLNPRGTGWLARRLLLGEFRRVASELRAYRRHSRASWGHAIKSEILSQLTPAPLVRAWRRRRAGLSLFGPAAPIAPGLLSMAESRGLPIDTRAARRSRATVPQMVEVLRQQQSGHAIGGSLLAAAHGMEFTQPYHDRRVVELALAIPEELHVRNGRDRHLARVALADVYPPEYQARGRANDDLIPDFAEMVQRIRPRLLEEIERMEKNGRLSKLFDFSRMRRMLREGKSEVAARHAVRTLLYARFVEWFQRDNRP